jgi:hypothetical protein
MSFTLKSLKPVAFVSGMGVLQTMTRRVARAEV